VPSGHCGAVRHENPFADELLTSWHARQRHSRRGRALPEPKAVRNRKGDWRHPDIRPTRAWLNGTADDLNVPATRLVEHSLAKHYPYLPVDFLAWEHPPGSAGSTGLIPVRGCTSVGAAGASRKISHPTGQRTSGVSGYWPLWAIAIGTAGRWRIVVMVADRGHGDLRCPRAVRCG
jgi:hypothetical protein